MMRILLALAAALIAMTSRAEAEVSDFARVACVGDIVIVQFAQAQDDEAPVFDRFEERLGPGLAGVPLDTSHPAECVLPDGARVRLMQSYLAANDLDSDWATPVFTLRIGDRIAFRRTPIRVRGENLSSIAIRDEQATICRQGGSCVERPVAFSDAAELAHPGALTVSAVRRRDRGLCQSLLRKEPPVVGWAPIETWPTYPHGERIFVGGDNWNGHWNQPPERFDLNNDGQSDQPVEARRDAHFGFWALPPHEIDERERTRIASELSLSAYEAVIARLRAEGWVVYTGAETRFAAVDLVFLNVVQRGEGTYLHAEQLGSNTEALLRPAPDGGMREVCVYERAPDL